MSAKHLFIQREIPFDYSYDEMNTPFVKEYSKMFEHLDLSHIPHYSPGGAIGYDTHSMIKAFIVYTIEGYRSIPKLIRELESKPYFSKYILGFRSTIPHNSQFYRFINSFDAEELRKILAQVAREKTDIKKIALDSKPVMANTKDNNPKSFSRNLSDKNKKPRRNSDATLGFYSKSNDENTNKETVVFFWGYRIHLIVDPHTDTPLTFKLEKNNKKDHDIAIQLYCKLLEYYPELYLSKIDQYADKGYYVKKIFKAFDLLFNGKSYIPVNKRNSKDRIFATPLCSDNKKMKYNSSWHEKKQDRFRIKFACPDNPKKCKLKSAKTGCYKYLQIRKPYKGEVQQGSPDFKKKYPLRQSVERVFSYLQLLGWENPKLFSKKGVENILGFALIGKTLKSLL